MPLTNLLTSLLQKALPQIQAIYLFGSIAQGQSTPESDVDIAILCPERLEPLHRWNLAQQLARELHRDVDLIDLQQASTVMRFQVVSTSERIYTQDENKMAWWELQVYQLYLTLNDDRKPILDEIKKTGTIYGR
uniref:Nucleotidyltransferase domain-containing protein n=1 Tax=Roseihalotalea indica TaxID=2867963 RepID=A0AA49GG82_9BACT|nr:nucleotidyltransferase domain-containing protein [Tunicatimonas sp. TK19036]